MCGDMNLTVGKQGLSYLAVRLVPDEAVAVTTAKCVPYSTKGDLWLPWLGMPGLWMVFFPSWVVIDSSRHLSWLVRTGLGSRHCSFSKCELIMMMLTGKTGICCW